MASNTETIYYWETENGYGRFVAKTDEEAQFQMPKGTIILYKESDTVDGLPFIYVYEPEKK